MHYRSEKYARIVDLAKNGTLPEVTIDYVKKREGRTPAESILLLKALMMDFRVTGDIDRREIIKQMQSLTTSRNSLDWLKAESIEWVICCALAGPDGEPPENFADRELNVFTDILWWCNGFFKDWKFAEYDVAASMNSDRLLKKSGLKVAISECKWPEPIEIELFDLSSGATLAKMTYQYEERDICYVADAVNQLLEPRGLAFVEAYQGGDDRTFVLFETRELERLNRKYGDVGRLINYNLRVDRPKGVYDCHRFLIDRNDRLTGPPAPEDAGIHRHLATGISQALDLYARGDVRTAWQRFTLSEDLCRHAGNLNLLQAALSGKAAIRRKQGDLEGALQLFARAARICRATGNLVDYQIALVNQARVLDQKGDPRGAIKLLEEAEHVGEAYGNKKTVVEALTIHAHILANMGLPQEALPLAEEALRLANGLNDEKITKQIQELIESGIRPFSG